MCMRRGRDLVFEAMREQEVPYLFGNPGTTELPLMDGLAGHPDIRYILALHEDVAVAAAMGWAVMTGRPGVVNLHVAPGLAHGLGNVYNAWRSRIPLVVTAGQHDTRFIHQEPVLWGDLVAMARPLTKWSVEPNSAEELAVLLPQAFKVAMTPPQGPVFMALPHDVLWGQTSAQTGPATVLPNWGPGDSSARLAFLDALSRSRRPLIIAGDAVTRAGAVTALVALAEAVGAVVMNEPLPAAINFPTTHPLYAGPLPTERGALRRVLDDADCLVLIGVHSQAPHAGYYGDVEAWPTDMPVLQLHDDPHEVAKVRPVTCPVMADVKAGLAALTDDFKRLARSSWTQGIADRTRYAQSRRQAWLDRRAAREAQAESQEGFTTIGAMRVLRENLPPEVLVVNEAVSSSVVIQEFLDYRQPLSFFGSKGGGLGHSMGAAIGAKIARPERPVVAITGDGSTLYYPQAIWTAAHHQIPVVFVVLNNTSYRILKINFKALGAPSADEGRYPAMDLDSPAPNFVQLAEALGVPGIRVDDAGSLARALQKSLTASGPQLIEVAVNKDW